MLEDRLGSTSYTSLVILDCNFRNLVTRAFFSRQITRFFLPRLYTFRDTFPRRRNVTAGHHLTQLKVREMTQWIIRLTCGHDSRRRDSLMGGLDDRISTARPRIGRRSQQTVAEGGRKGWRKPRRRRWWQQRGKMR